MNTEASQSLSEWEGRLVRLEKEVDFYMEDPLPCCDMVFFEEELASCRMYLREARASCPEDRYARITSLILHVERKLDILKAREQYPWSASFV